MTETIAFLTALGVGSIVAAWIGRSVAITGHRQGWINALRDDVALFFKELSSGRFDIVDTEVKTAKEEKDESIRKARIAALQVYYRILLRLNQTEELHVQLGDTLETLLLLGINDIDMAMMSSSVLICQRILKREWAVAKYGSFMAPKIAKLRGQEW